MSKYTTNKEMQTALEKANAALDSSGVFEKSITGFPNLREAIEDKTSKTAENNKCKCGPLPAIKMDCENTPGETEEIRIPIPSDPSAPLTGGAEILTSRPEGMSHEDYKRLRKEQNKALKGYGRGDNRLVFCAVKIFDVIPNPNYDPDRELTSPEDIERGYANDNPPRIEVPYDPKRKNRIETIRRTVKRPYTNKPQTVNAEAVEQLKHLRGEYFDEK